MQTKPIIPYTEVESEFIQEAIKDREYDNRPDRVYVNELVCIESFVRHQEWYVAPASKPHDETGLNLFQDCLLIP